MKTAHIGDHRIRRVAVETEIDMANAKIAERSLNGPSPGRTGTGEMRRLRIFPPSLSNPKVRSAAAIQRAMGARGVRAAAFSALLAFARMWRQDPGFKSDD